ncbi:hypothetical protein [Streptomyces sp. TRM64462]|uniref:hypothetical protein n=1 Tax=Streptomyces sp. TRM64462 TaxID=2741726 RepID=UPI0015867DB8|nr:hypothetical protein [Streptomyces sp. TRM64462]
MPAARAMPAARTVSAVRTMPAVPAVLAALTVLLTASCGADTKAADGAGTDTRAGGAASGKPAGTCELSGSTEQITARFSMLGEVVSTQWCAIDLTQDSGRVPGPSDIRLVGYFDTTAADMKALLGRSDWTFKQVPLPELPEPVVRAAGVTSSSTSAWVTSAELEKTVTREVYSGSFYVDEKANRIVFDTVNPVKADAKVEYY